MPEEGPDIKNPSVCTSSNTQFYVYIFIATECAIIWNNTYIQYFYCFNYVLYFCFVPVVWHQFT